MYLNNGQLKAPTVYQLPHLYLKPGESSAVTVTVKCFRDITHCPGDWCSRFPSDTTPSNDDY
jgi:hypothetical protein